MAVELKPMTYVPHESLTKMDSFCRRGASEAGDVKKFDVVFDGKRYECDLLNKKNENGKRPIFLFETFMKGTKQLALSGVDQLHAS